MVNVDSNFVIRLAKQIERIQSMDNYELVKFCAESYARYERSDDDDFQWHTYRYASEEILKRMGTQMCVQGEN